MYVYECVCVDALLYIRSLFLFVGCFEPLTPQPSPTIAHHRLVIKSANPLNLNIFPLQTDPLPDNNPQTSIQYALLLPIPVMVLHLEYIAEVPPTPIEFFFAAVYQMSALAYCLSKGRSTFFYRESRRLWRAVREEWGLLRGFGVECQEGDGDGVAGIF